MGGRWGGGYGEDGQAINIISLGEEQKCKVGPPPAFFYYFILQLCVWHDETPKLELLADPPPERSAKTHTYGPRIMVDLGRGCGRKDIGPEEVPGTVCKKYWSSFF